MTAKRRPCGSLTRATVSNVNDPYAPGTLGAVNTHYRRPNITINPYGETMFGLSSSGCMTLTAEGHNNFWKTPGSGRQRRLYRVWELGKLEQNIETLITRVPRP